MADVLAPRFQQIPEPTNSSPEIEAHALNLQRQAIEAIELLPQAPPELVAMFQGTTAPGALADRLARRGERVTAEAIASRISQTCRTVYLGGRDRRRLG